jgi:protein phosphatase 2C family protein 2/3
MLITANVGDCRAVLSKEGKAVLLSVDQKPYNPKEKKRIEEAGGKVELNRISG